MNALSPSFAIEQSNAKPAPRTRKRISGGVIRRELLAHWLGPLLIVAALAVAHQIGLFLQTDGRLFDFATVHQSGQSPTVVIIERDPQFETQDAGRFGKLERSLADLGTERIGYLDADRGPVAQSPAPVVVAMPVRALPRNNRWELPSEAEALGNARSAARSIASSQYGIHRTQFSEIPGRKAPIAVFDAALADTFPQRSEFLVPMPGGQSIPVFKASQLTSGAMNSRELDGIVAMVVSPDALTGKLNTPLSPNEGATSEAVFRAHTINALRTGSYSYRASLLESCLVLLFIGAFLAAVFRKADSKSLAVIVPVMLSIAIAAACWAALRYTGLLLPVSALMLAPWIVTFQRVLVRETAKDRRLERTASRAVQTSFNRSALREGARLPEFLGSAARYAGVERSLLIELLPNGKLEAIAANNASLSDIELEPKALKVILKELHGSMSPRAAADIVPGWESGARIGWIGAGGQNLFWLHARPDVSTPGKSAHLVRAITTSFRELFRWRADLNARSGHNQRTLPIDDKVASAIALVARESEQVRRGFDTVDTAVIIFHLIGAPLHANTAMQAIYAEAGLSLFETSLPETLLALTDLDRSQIDALIKDLMLNGTEVRMPMRDIGTSERMLRLAAPARNANRADRILVLEAMDMRDANRAADLRKAVAHFIDLQLRNDFEAVLLGSQLASDERLTAPQIRGVVERIGETARRATGRLNEVAGLIRMESRELTEACYPVDAAEVVKESVEKARSLADELGVVIEAEHPGIGGFILAEPNALGEMLVAMLRVVIADTPQNGVVKLKFEDRGERIHIRISGGFGIGFDRLLWLLSNYEEGAVGEYRLIGESIAKVTGWSATVSYWGSESNGFGFNVDLRGLI